MSCNDERQNNVEPFHDRNLCIHQLFETQVARTPHAPALLAGSQRWTYEELNARANQVAHRLRSMRMDLETAVAVDLPRSPDAIAALLGILKAGAAFAPLDSNDPAARREAVLRELEPAALITAEWMASLPGWGSENPANLSQPTHLAYIMFTSGSTGIPKGVMVEHRSVVRLVRQTDFARFDDRQVFLQLAPLPFDASTLEIWGALLNGSALAIPRPGLLSLAEIAASVKDFGVTTLWLTAGLFNAMVDQQLEALKSVSQLLTGGDVLSPPHVRRFLDVATGTRLINGYGPTEGTTFTCCYTIPREHPGDAPVPIGTPIAHTTVHILNEAGVPVEAGESGELYAGGDGIARGYWRRPELTAERFRSDPSSSRPEARLYRTGDLVRQRPDGVIEFLGRVDGQIKLRGFRIEPGEIEAALTREPEIRQAAVTLTGESTSEKRLVAFLVSANGHVPIAESLRERLRVSLPAYMIPAEFFVVDALPLTANGKVDRRALVLPAFESPVERASVSSLSSTVEEVWQKVLGIASPDPDRSFFELGGSSLQLLRVQGLLEQRLGRTLAVTDLFRYPTIRAMVAYIDARPDQKPQPKSKSTGSRDIAIIGMAARLPGALDVRQFWENVKNGVESISFFADDELEAPKPPGAVSARPVLEDVDLFDASHFGILPKEAATIDPQHRVFLECSVDALEDGGYDPARFEGDIGVFAGCSPNTYFLKHLCADREYIEDYTDSYQVGNYQTMIGTSSDFLSTRVSYKLNLTGPSITMGTACSTSLVAVAQACESLFSGSSDMALAGGVSITFPQKRAYVHQEGGIVSPDGHCRAFDADAAGTVFGSGCGVVLLRRLDDALAAGDSIYAVIKGYGITNDGADKMAFTAPSAAGQAKAVEQAQRMAEVSPEDITYVEAHGTGTPLGDPIEIAGLTQAFRSGGATGNQFCAIGSAKANVGHLDAAAGITGLIKAALCVRDGVLPPMVHFRIPNPRIDFANSPFYVNRERTTWNPPAGIRRAGISAFGVGGTNAHLVLEQAAERSNSAGPVVSELVPALFLLSAKSPEALDQASLRLDEFLVRNADVNPADAAYTLQTGRRRFAHRRMKIAGSTATAHVTRDLPVAFTFPGQGAQHPSMGRSLYEACPVFRETVDQCAGILLPILGFDIRAHFDADALNQTALTQPAIFVLEYALAQQWMAWGVKPAAMIGHSVGEFVAATLSGVFSLADALSVVAARGRLMQDLPGGSMLSVRAADRQIAELLGPELSIAAVNSPALCVVAGPDASIEMLEQELTARAIASRKLRTSHAFHSAMMDPIAGPLRAILRQMQLSSPAIPYVSTLTGDWITPELATDPEYWVRHCRQTVRFSEAVRTLQSGKPWCVLEVGPGQALTTLVRQHAANPHALEAVASMPDPSSSTTEPVALFSAMGKLWLSGIESDWQAVHAGLGRRRVSLPTYPFQRQRFWVEAKTSIPHKLLRNHTMSVINIPPSAPARRQRLEGEILTMLEELSGMGLKDVSASASFLELGFDSLFLTQLTQSLESKYGAKIRFAQLLDDLSSPEALAGYLDAGLPAEVAPPPTPAAPVAAVAPAAIPATGGSAIEQLLQQQLQAFNDLASRQLEALRGAPPAAPPAALPTPTRVASAPATVSPKFESFGPYKPIQKGPSDGLTKGQSESLSQLIQSYTTRTAGSKRLTQQHRSYLADPRVAAGFRAAWKEMVYPIHMERSSGSKLWDVDGNEYIDLLNGFGVTMFGHGPDFVREAVARQLEMGIEIGPQTPHAGNVAQLLCELTGMERATFCNTGSEAVMAAMRLARTVTGRSKVCYFAGDYHGAFDEVLVKGVQRPGEPPRSRPIAPGIPEQNVGNMIVLEYGSPASLDYLRCHAGELAAVLVEPVQSRHGDLQPVEFLRELREITRRADTCLIFDEVVTGFRTHPGGAQALFNIRADLATYGKVIGGGLPIGALAGSCKYMDALDGGMWHYGDDSSPEVGVTFFAGTFVRHPLAMAACWAVLNHIRDAGPALQEDLSSKTGNLVRTLNQLFREGGVPAKIENFRSIFYFSFPATERFAGLLYYHLREKGIHIQEGFPCFLTTAHSELDLQKIVSAFRSAIEQMQRGGFLTAPATASLPSDPPVEAWECQAPLTEAQMEIRLSAQLGEEESCAYNEGFTVRLRGDLDEGALRESLVTVVNRHEALRAHLTPAGDALHVEARIQIPLPVVDAASAADVERMQVEDALTPFDLVNGPLIRAKLARLATDHHVLFITAHHLICDGWSTNILLDELSKLYSARRKGRPAAVGAGLTVPMRFSEYAVEQSRQNVDAKVEGYWVSEFADPAPPLELPLDRPRPVLKSYHGATLIARIDANECRQIQRAGAQCGATLFSTLLGGFQALLGRLTGQSDIVVGIPAAAQAALAGQTLVGHCVNFLPIRTKLGRDASVKELLRQTKAKVLEAYEHQSYTYGTLVRKLAIPRNPSRLPLIEVQFNLERVGSGLQFEGLTAQVMQSPKRFVNFDLFVNAVEGPDGITFYTDYNTDLLDAATVERWLRHYRTLLLGMAGDIEQPAAAVLLLAENEVQELAVEWNRTAMEFPADQCLHELIASQAARTPNAIAVRDEKRTLTYRQLELESTRMAHWLVRRGVERGDLVGLSLEPSVDILVAVLGVLIAGGAYVPLDPAYPAERLAFIQKDAGLKLTLTQANWPVLDSVQPITTPASDPNNAAYVIYTSGSTGTPKGVEIQHKALVNFLWSMRQEPGITSSDRLLAVTTLSFDIAGLELFLPLVSGATVVIAGHDARRDGRKLAHRIEAEGITIVQATPTTWKLLLEAGWTGNLTLKMLCGGEELTRDLANKLIPLGASLWNMYGPTETTIWSATTRVEAGDGPVSIGRPIGNTQIHILDSRMQPVPVGVLGELCIGGEGLARGYWNRPELTADRFVQYRGARIYRTGDIARYLPDGRVLCVGRLDQQVKIRGHRIELGEVESALLSYPAVRDGAVIVREDRPGEKRLVAYFVPSREATPNLEDLRSFLGGRVPDYMVPAVLESQEALPLTPNGKIDRRALALLPPPSFVQPDRYAAPRRECDRVLARVWEEVLHLDRVGIDDDLFSLGADSIHMFQISARAAREGLELSPRQLLHLRTIRKVSDSLDLRESATETKGARKGPSMINAVPRENFRMKRPV